MSDRERSVWHGDCEAECRDRFAEERDDLADDRDLEADARDRDAHDRDHDARERDRKAQARDVAALRRLRALSDVLHDADQQDATGEHKASCDESRDESTADIDDTEHRRVRRRAAGNGGATPVTGRLAVSLRGTVIEALNGMQDDRLVAAADRGAAANDRLVAAADRRAAANDRRAAAADRDAVAADRDAAAADRDAADRHRAAVEWAQQVRRQRATRSSIGALGPFPAPEQQAVP